MALQSLREDARLELESLADEQLRELLDYMRFLRVRHATRAARDRAFTDALEQAREIAARQGITEQDINEEIATVRAGR